MRRALVLLGLWAVLSACSSEEASSEEPGRCVPGETRRCPCAGASTGIQQCLEGGSFGKCQGCAAGAGGQSGGSQGGQAGSWPGGGQGGAAGGGQGGSGGQAGQGGSQAGAGQAGSGQAGSEAGGSAGSGGGQAGAAGGGGAGDPCAGHCGDGAQNCGETGLDCGGECAACYGLADCVSDNPPRNDAEVCDDAEFTVPGGESYVLVCLNTKGGVGYVASNTGPVMFDGIARCQGWEQSTPPQPLALSYLAKLDCVPGGAGFVPVDLGSYAGKKVWYGAHEQPGGAGHDTEVCLAVAKGGPSCAGHCGDGAQDCGETGLDCGGECPPCAVTGYVYADCKSHEAVSNGSEDCDDTWMEVQAPGTQYALVCFSDAGGVAYVSTNTGPVMSDGVARCQGWEEQGVWAGSQLDYLTKTVCDQEQKIVPLDLSAWVGKTVHMGTHTHEDGSGHATVACIAQKK